MPMYQYKCKNCETEKEALQKVSDAPLLFCTECSNYSLIKLMTAPNFKFNGNGYYCTDFKNK